MVAPHRSTHLPSERYSVCGDVRQRGRVTVERSAREGDIYACGARARARIGCGRRCRVATDVLCQNSGGHHEGGLREMKSGSRASAALPKSMEAPERDWTRLHTGLDMRTARRAIDFGLAALSLGSVLASRAKQAPRDCPSLPPATQGGFASAVPPGCRTRLISQVGLCDSRLTSCFPAWIRLR